MSPRGCFTQGDFTQWIEGESILRVRTDNGKIAKVYLGVYEGLAADCEGFRLQIGTKSRVEIKFDHVTGFDQVKVMGLLDQLAEARVSAE